MGHQFKVAADIGFKLGQIARGRHAGKSSSRSKSIIRNSGAGCKTTAKTHLKAVQGHVFAHLGYYHPFPKTP
jgi:hypothetical protein